VHPYGDPKVGTALQPGPPRSEPSGLGGEETLITHVEVPRNAESPVSALRPRRTPTAAFFVRSHFPTPTATKRWRLTVDGGAGRPRSWNLRELRTLPQRRLAATLECAGNGRARHARPAPGELRWGEHAVGSAVWTGVPLTALLDEVELRPDARHLVFLGADRGDPAEPADRFERSLAADPRGLEDVLVATEMNGSPLSAEHGAPARLVVPGWYGMAWVKWLCRVEARRDPFRGHFQATKYLYRSVRDGVPAVEPVERVRVKSLLVAPVPGERLARGSSYCLAGKAWSGAAPIAKVEVDTGDGWSAARLRPGDGRYDWSSWEFDWVPQRAGPVTIRGRATDGLGQVQPEAPLENEYQYGTNSVQSVAVDVA
jgi:DMSO/TMAO reductase YedYZ molybdopterin-dependent catalytic subunit